MPVLSSSAEATVGARVDASAPEMFAEQVRLLYRLSKPAYVGTLVNVIVIGMALRNLTPLPVLLSWIALATGATLVRYSLFKSYFSRERKPEEASLWANRFIGGALAMGCLWGVLGTALLPTGEIMFQFLIMFLVVAMVASATIVLTPVKLAFLAFAVPALVPLTVAMFMQSGEVYFYMGILLLVFIAVLAGVFPVMHETHAASLRMRGENTALVADLSEANRRQTEQLEQQRRTDDALRQSTQKLEALIDASPLGIVVFDMTGKVQSWNLAAERLFGWTEQEVIGKPNPLFPPGLSAEAQTHAQRILSGQPYHNVDTVRLRKDGAVIDVSISAAPLRDGAGAIVGRLAIFSDISERKRREQRQNLEYAVRVMLSEADSIGAVMPRILQLLCESWGWAAGARRALDDDHAVLRCAESWCERVPEIENFMRQSALRTDTAAENAGLLRKVWATNKPVWLTDIAREPTFARGPAALAAGLNCAFAFPVIVGGAFASVVELFGRTARPRDDEMVIVAETLGSLLGEFIARKEAELHVAYFASHDALTGLPNRVTFSEWLARALARAQRYRTMVGVLFIDLDRFKVINDTLGHDIGDRLLTQLGAELRECLRESDIIARQGGDEFVVAVENVTDPNHFAGVAQKILEAVAQPRMLGGHELRVTGSIGISVYPEDGTDLQSLLKNADIAMYRAKEQGKNNFQFYSAQMNQHTFERLALETSLRRAIERREFLLHYQPKVELRSGRITGVEALVRWRHPDLGMVSPAQFVPLAEETGLIADIGEWVLRTACMEARTWESAGNPGVSVAVNLSARQFAGENLARNINTILGETGLDARALELEITESTVMQNPGRAATILQQFKAMGIRITIDDFGTGYSSLGYLKRFPVDSVKVDRSFILDIPNDADDVAITLAVIAMAHSLRLKVVAEGVETEAQYQFLRDHGCDEMQGYYLSAPVDAASLARLMAEWRGGFQAASA